MHILGDSSRGGEVRLWLKGLAAIIVDGVGLVATISRHAMFGGDLRGR